MAPNDSIIFGVSSDNRYVELYNLLSALLAMLRPNDHVVIAIRCSDSVLIQLKQLTQKIGKEKAVTFLVTNLQSSAAKRNAILDWAAKHQEFEYLFFMDDDLLLPNNLLDCLADFASREFEIGAVAPSVREVMQIDQSDTSLGIFRFKFLQNFYPPRHRVAKSGWHGVRGASPKILEGIWWNNVAALVVRVNKVKGFKFPPLERYSYLEDVFFTRELSEKGLILATSDVNIGHLGYDKYSFEFGLMEVINRYKLAKTITHCGLFFYCMILIRLMVNCSGIFKNNIIVLRVLGNLRGIFSLCKTS